MTVYAQKWGIRIPKVILEQLDIKSGNPLDIKEENGKTVISKAPQKSSLDDRLRDFGAKYELTEEDRIWLDAKPVGKEIW